MPRPPKPCRWEYLCHECGQAFYEAGVDVPEDFPRPCSHCKRAGIISYYAREKV